MTSSNQKTYVLITGGAGYVGSHCCVEVQQAGYNVIVVDNCCNAVKGTNGIPESINRVQQITGKDVIFHQVDLLDKEALKNVFSKYSIQAVIHAAALKCVPESIERPLEYYRVNLEGVMNLLWVMKDNEVKNLIFSSSSTVYGASSPVPFVETYKTGTDLTNPYGRSKYFTEVILGDIYETDKSWNIILLRYFSPTGAHESGLIGECPPVEGKARSLMPVILETALGKRSHVNVFGDDFDTRDGTVLREFTHVVDVAEGHVSALRKLSDNCGLKIYNLGTGKPHSVLEMIAGMEKTSGKKISYVIKARRPGDIGVAYADSSLALKELGWKATRSLEQRCEDLWRFYTMNPKGYIPLQQSLPT